MVVARFEAVWSFASHLGPIPVKISQTGLFFRLFAVTPAPLDFLCRVGLVFTLSPRFAFPLVPHVSMADC